MCLAVVISLVPAEVASAAVALYLFIINNIGGAMTLFLPPLEAAIGLQYALTVLFPGPYVVAAGLFALTQVVLHCQGRKERTGGRGGMEASPLIQNQDSDSDSDYDEVEEREGREGRGLGRETSPQREDWMYVMLDENVVRWRTSEPPPMEDDD